MMRDEQNRTEHIADNRASFRIALPDSPHLINSKQIGFRALHLAGRNEFHLIFV